MKIAQVSPLIESVPPIQYGGTEQVVSFLTEDTRRGSSSRSAWLSTGPYQHVQSVHAGHGKVQEK